MAAAAAAAGAGAGAGAGQGHGLSRNSAVWISHRHAFAKQRQLEEPRHAASGPPLWLGAEENARIFPRHIPTVVTCPKPHSSRQSKLFISMMFSNPLEAKRSICCRFEIGVHADDGEYNSLNMVSIMLQIILTIVSVDNSHMPQIGFPVVAGN
jgi:hypothetical protein